jgi:hypothetical protein
MSFRPASFKDIHRSGPPTTTDGKEWTVHLSAPPPAEWLVLFQADARGDEAAGSVRWPVNVQFVELRFASTPDNLPRAMEHLEQRIIRANDDYRSWLDAAHRKGEARQQDAVVEADRVRELNERFKNL